MHKRAIYNSDHELFRDNARRFFREELEFNIEQWMAKLRITESGNKIVDDCLKLFGGYGYMREYPIARLLVNSRVRRIYGGT